MRFRRARRGLTMVNMMTYDLERAEPWRTWRTGQGCAREVKDLIGYLRNRGPPRISAANYTNPAKQEARNGRVDVRESIGSAEAAWALRLFCSALGTRK